MAPAPAVSRGRVNQQKQSKSGARQRKQQQEDNRREQILEDNDAAYQSYLVHVKKKNGGRALIMPLLPDNMLDQEDIVLSDHELDNNNNDVPNEAPESPPRRPKKGRGGGGRLPAVRKSKTSPAVVAVSLPEQIGCDSDDSLALNAESTVQTTPQLRKANESGRLLRYTNSLMGSKKAAPVPRGVKAKKKSVVHRSASADSVTPNKQPRRLVHATKNTQLQAFRRRLTAHPAFESVSDEAPEDAYFPDNVDRAHSWYGD